MANIEGCFSSDRMDWETPDYIVAWMEDYLELWYNVEGGFTLDVCASVKNHKALRYYTKAKDGLSQDWETNVCWMNPPYGREIGAWIEKAYLASLEGALVVGLIPARTDTKYWAQWINQPNIEIIFLTGRVKFKGGISGAPFPSCIVIWRPYIVTKTPMLNGLYHNFYKRVNWVSLKDIKEVHEE